MLFKNTIITDDQLCYVVFENSVPDLRSPNNSVQLTLDDFTPVEIEENLDSIFIDPGMDHAFSLVHKTRFLQFINQGVLWHVNRK